MGSHQKSDGGEKRGQSSLLQFSDDVFRLKDTLASRTAPLKSEIKGHRSEIRRIEDLQAALSLFLLEAWRGYSTVTSVPIGTSAKNFRATSSGSRMQPSDAG